MTYDAVLEAAGSFGRYQIQLFFILFVNAIPNALLFTAIVFLHYVPDHRCSLEHLQTQNLTYNSTSLNVLYPWDVETNTVSKCTIYNVTDEQLKALKINNTTFISHQVIDCPNGWVYDNPFGIQSPMMEFQYLCDESWYVPLMSSLFMFGMLSSTATGPLSDRFGRRPVFLATTLIQFVATFLCSFTNSATFYGMLMFTMGFSQMANYISAFIIGAEFTIPTKRNLISISSYISFSVGYIIAPCLAYLIPNWRWLLRVNGMIGFLYIPMYWLMPESPRWLIAQGQMEKAKKIFHKIATCNKKAESLSILKDEINLLSKEEQMEKRVGMSQLNQLKKMASSLQMLFIVLVTMLSFFTVSVIYTGFSMSVQALSGNMYINAALLGAIELPGEVVAYLAVQYISRPISHGGLMLMTGLSCLSIALAKNSSTIFTLLASLFGKMCNLAVYYILYIHTTEIAPTLTRNSLMSTGTIISGMGGIVSPYFVHAVKEHGFFLPYLLLALLAITSSILTLFVLPETKGVALPETVEDALNFKTYLKACGICASQKKPNKQPKKLESSIELERLENM